MSSPAIQSALTQMQSLATQAAGQSAKGQQVSAAKAQAFQAGDPSVELNDLMVDMQKASVAFQMGTQVRNRLVTAYKDVMNMQV